MSFSSEAQPTVVRREDVGQLHGEGPEAALRTGTLSGVSVMAQSVGAIAPAGAMAILVAPVALAAGNGAWLTWLISMVTIVLVGACISALARRISGAGSLFTFAEVALGPKGGSLVGPGLILLAAASVPVVTIAISNFVMLLVAGVFDVDISGSGYRYGLYALTLGAGIFFALREVRVSTRVLLMAELATVLAVVAVLVAAVVHHGTIADSHQLKLSRADSGGVFNGVVVAFFAFAGFETASALGLEAKDPRRAIPRAVIGSILITGVFFVANAYVQQLGLGLGTLTSSPSPLNALADEMHASWLGYSLDVFLLLSGIASVVAGLNHIGRILLAGAERRLLPAAFARTSSRRKVPWVGITILISAEFVFLAIITMIGADPNKILGYCSTVSGLGVLVVYLVTVVATPVFLRRRGELGAAIVAVSVLAAAVILIVLVQSVRGATGSPERYLPWGVLAYLVISFVALSAVRARRPSSQGSEVVLDRELSL